MSGEEDQQNTFGLLQDEQDDKQDQHDELELDPDMSDPETEVNIDDGTETEAKITPTWRKYREFNPYQKISFKSSRALPRDRFEEMLKVEQAIDPIIDHQIGGALALPLENSGSKLVEALWLVHRVSQGILVTLQRRSVGQLIVRCLQYLYFRHTQADIAADKLRSLLGSLSHQKFDLVPIQEYFQQKEVLENHITNYFEKYHSTEELNVGSDSGLSIIKSVLQIVKRFKFSFVAHEEFLFSYMFERKYDFAHPEFHDFLSFIVPLNKLSKHRLDALTNMVLHSRKLDLKTSSLSLKYWRNAIKNPHFRASAEAMSLIASDIKSFKLALTDVRALSKNSSTIAKIGRMWTQIILPAGNTEPADIQASIQTALTSIKGQLECWVSDYHPKTLPTVSREFLFVTLGSFVSAFTRQLTISRKTNPQLATTVYEALKDPIRKCMNFAIFSKFSDNFQTNFTKLAYLDQEYFGDYFLQKIKFAFDYPGFSKTKLMKIVDEMSTLICKHERLSTHLMWIVPKFLLELENVAEQGSADQIGSCLASFLENFIGVERAGRGPAHLRDLKDDMDEAALRLFDFYHRKTGDFGMPFQLLQVLLNSGSYVQKKIKEKSFELLKQGLEKSLFQNAAEIVHQLYLVQPEETEAELSKYLLKRLLTKQIPTEVSTLTLGHILTKLGIHQQEYALTSDNENTLKKQIDFIRSVGCRILRLSEPLFHQTMIFLVLAFQSKYESVVQAAGSALGGLVKSYQHEFAHPIAIWEYEEKIHQKKINEAKQAFWTDETHLNQGRAVQLFEAVYIGTLQTIEGLVHSFNGNPKGHLLLPETYPTEPLFRSTLIEGVDAHSQNQAIDSKLTALLQLLTTFAESEFVRNLRIYSPVHRALLESCFTRITDYLYQTGSYRVPKLREQFLKYYLELMNGLQRFGLQHGHSAHYLRALMKYMFCIDDQDTCGKLLTAKSINLQYAVFASSLLPNPRFDGFCQPQLPAELNSWVSSIDVHLKCTASNWIFSPQATTDLFHRYIKTNFQMSTLFYGAFDVNGLQPYISWIKRSWLVFDDEFVLNHCIKPWEHIVAIQQNQEIKYTNTYRIVGLALSRSMPQHPLASDQLIEAYLNLGDHMIKKANFSKAFPNVLMIVEFLLRIAAPTSNSQLVAGLDASLTALESSSDGQTTLVDMLGQITRILITFKYWSTQQRARFLLLAIEGLAAKDINKRIVWTSMLLFGNRLIKKTDIQETKVRVRAEPFLDTAGFLSSQNTYQAVQEIRKRLGLTTEGTCLPIDAKQAEEFAKVDASLLPTKAIHTFSLPWEFSKVNYLTDTPAEAANLLATNGRRAKIEDALREFIKLSILDYSEALNESSLSVGYNFVRMLVETRNIQGNFGKESQTFAALKVASTLLGYQSSIKVFESIKQEYFESQQSADAKKVLMIMLAAMLSSSARYNQADFEAFVQFLIETLKPLMNKTGFKSVETIVMYLGLACKQSLNFGRLQHFFTKLAQAMKSEHLDNQPYYLRLLSFQYSSCQLLVSDWWTNIITDTLSQISYDEMAGISNLSLILMTTCFNRVYVGYSSEFAAVGLETVPISELSYPLAGAEGQTLIDKQLTDAIEILKGKKLLAKIEFLKTAIAIFYAKRLDQQNFKSLTGILSLCFSIDSNEDQGIQQLVGVFQKSLLRLVAAIHVTKPTKDQFAEFLYDQHEKATSIDSIKILISLTGLAVESEITPTVATLIEKIARDQRVPLRETIETALRHLVFNNIPNAPLYVYARTIFGKVDAASLQK